MINIIDKSKCCGCNACVQCCPKQCITMQEDEEGFFYPHVNQIYCIDCGLCNKVCPMLATKSKKGEPLYTSAAINPDKNTRLNSSSGGVFSLLAEEYIKQNGIVFGAQFNNNWNVEHKHSESIQDLSKLRGSKYVQSYIGDTYILARKYLLEGKKVLFSGTPCQISGLKLFLHKDYENLLTVECVCHGIPSPGLWRQYLHEQTQNDNKKLNDIININFRSKDNGWEKYHVVIQYKDGTKSDLYHGDNPWTRSFIYNYNLRPSCSNCPAKCENSNADITLGDFWGVNQILPSINDNYGTTLVVIHTQKGKNIINHIENKEVSFSQIVAFNKSLIYSTPRKAKCDIFFQKAKKQFIPTVRQMTKESLSIRIKIYISKLLKR